MKTFDFTPGELKAAMIMVLECLAGMGGSRPSDLEDDEYTWTDAETLMAHGYSRHEAAGFISSLSDKGFLEDNNLGGRGGAEWVVATSGWRYIDTVWDDNQHLLI